MNLLSRLLGKQARPVNWGDLRRLTPISAAFGQDRGTPVRRHYIEAFLDSCRADLHGRVLEVGDDRYAQAFAAADATIDVLSPSAETPKVTVVGDLMTGDGIPDERFDAIILTQVLHVIYDMRASIATAHRALRPGGVLLASLPALTQISRFDYDRWGDYWRVTDMAAQRLFDEAFPGGSVTTTAYGNILTATASLYGVSAQELSAAELSHYDPDYQILVGVRAQKADH
ncbi:MAG: class I SAM-dependent methyltransferase [Ferrovibrio sp.]|uniref:class I SAM-dependent methyltransferase n=1 Tax=Ferrovibrio sp. TaxID=1917215 RepID=UPI00391B5A56